MHINCEVMMKSSEGASRLGVKPDRILRISVTDTGAGISKVRYCAYPRATYSQYVSTV